MQVCAVLPAFAVEAEAVLERYMPAVPAVNSIAADRKTAADFAGSTADWGRSIVAVPGHNTADLGHSTAAEAVHAGRSTDRCTPEHSDGTGLSR